MAHRGSRGIALSFHDHGARRGWGVSVTSRPLFTPGKDPVPIVQEAGWAPGLVWTGAENLAPTGIRSPDRPACSQSLYRLHYLAHLNCNIVHKKQKSLLIHKGWCHSLLYCHNNSVILFKFHLMERGMDSTLKFKLNWSTFWGKRRNKESLSLN